MQDSAGTLDSRCNQPTSFGLKEPLLTAQPTLAAMELDDEDNGSHAECDIAVASSHF